MPHRYLLTSVEEGVGVLQLNHPEKRNALGWDLHTELIDALGAWAYDDAVACVLLIGTEEHFCAGWDLDVLDGISGADQADFTALAMRLMAAIYDYRKPTVAGVAGMAPGYGMDVANMCDVTIASANARFGSTQVKYAMNGFYGGMARKVGPMRARRMYFTGDSIDATEAWRIGMVDEVVPAGELLDRSRVVARRIAEAGTELLTVLKEVALRAQNMDHLGGLAYELRVTHDLTQRGLFNQRLPEGRSRLKGGPAGPPSAPSGTEPPPIMSDLALAGRRVIVSGSTRGLGHAFARHLAGHGASVVINGRDAERCRTVAAELTALGAGVAAVTGSIADEPVAEELAAVAVERFGGIDLVVNNAGITRDRTLPKMTVAEFDDVVATHLRGAWLLSRAAARHMAGRGGAILNVVSGSALYGLVGQSNYAAAKGGLLALTRALSVELGDRGIRVNALYPVAATDMTRPVIDALGHDRVPFGDPDDVAPVVSFLASPAADGITGQIIAFDGRHLAYWTHPEPRGEWSRDRPWAADDIADFFASTTQEPLHVDRWGAGARRPAAGPTTGRPPGDPTRPGDPSD